MLLSQENSRDRSGERVSRFPRQEMLLQVSRGSSFPVSEEQVLAFYPRLRKLRVDLDSNPNFPPLVARAWGEKLIGERRFTPCFSIRGKENSLIRYFVWFERDQPHPS